jgi:hypothetical protein
MIALSCSAASRDDKLIIMLKKKQNTKEPFAKVFKKVFR